MPIRAVVFDIGGVLEVGSDGREPTIAFPQMAARWDARLDLRPGEMDGRLRAVGEQLRSQGKDGSVGTCTEAEWHADLRRTAGLDDAQFGAFLRDFWDVYCGRLNVALAAYFAGLRPRYRTALLSNSFVGARREEQQRHRFDEICDLIIYSHEAG